MTRLYQAVDGVLFVFGAFVIHLSLELAYRDETGPGPGFFSFWLGVLLMGLAVLDFVTTTRRPREPLPDDFVPAVDGRVRVAAIVVGLCLALAALPWAGFSLTMLVFTAVLLRVMGRQAWWVNALISLGGSFGMFYLFKQLQVYLPAGPWGF